MMAAAEAEAVSTVPASVAAPADPQTKATVSADYHTRGTVSAHRHTKTTVSHTTETVSADTHTTAFSAAPARAGKSNYTVAAMQTRTIAWEGTAESEGNFPRN
jgi:hypothetical protein